MQITSRGDQSAATRGQLTRSREIVHVLVRHGLGFFVDALGLDRVIPFHRGLLGHPKRAEPYTRPEHVRMALEDLGPTFVKLGQIASTHGDLLPPDYRRELARLQDGVAPAPTTAIRTAIEAELGTPVETAFAAFEDEAVAAASIGQAHAARLHDGTEVIVKVRRPGADASIRSDLALIRSFAEAASTRSQLADRYDLGGIVEEFSTTLLSELDFEREAESIARFSANFAGDATVRIPRVFRQVSGGSVLTLERLRGIRIDDLAALDAAGIDRAALAARTSRLFMKMVFEDGFFHADPHPGNLFVEADGRIGLIDFGMTGTVDQATRDRLVDVLLALTGRDPSRLADALLALGFARGRVDRTLLERDLARLVEPYYELAIGDISIGVLLQDTLEVIRKHHLVLPRELALLVKTVVMSDGLAAHVAPEFKFMTVLIPYARRLMARRFSPEALGPRLAGAAADATRLALTLPHRVDRLLGAFERGDLELPVRPAGFEPIVERLERSVDRVVLGIVAAAFMNGLAVFVSVYHPAGWQTQAPLALVFGLAAGVGAYLVRSVMRPARR